MWHGSFCVISVRPPPPDHSVGFQWSTAESCCEYTVRRPVKWGHKVRSASAFILYNLSALKEGVLVRQNAWSELTVV